MKIRSHLFWLVAGAVIPLLVFSAGLTWYVWGEQRQSVELRQLERVRAMTIALDTELTAVSRVLRTLALQVDGREDDAWLAQRMREVLATQPLWSALAVGDREWRQVTAVGAKGREPAPLIDPRMRERILATQLPAVSGVLSRGGRYETQVAVPLLVEGRIERILLVVVEQAAWLRFMGQYPTAPGTVLALLDQDGRIIARTRDNERWAGAPAAAAVQQHADASSEAAYRGTSIEGEDVYFAHSRSPRWAWTVVTGVPTHAVEEVLRDSTGLLLAIAACTGAVVFLLAFLLGRRIERPITALGESAHALARGEPPPVPPSSDIDEVAQVAGAFREASGLLIERRRALNEALTREQQARHEAEQANRAKDEFLAMLGHELRNPLNALTGAFSILRHPGAAADAASRAREIAARQIQALRSLVDDLLDVARVTTGKIVLHRAPLDLGALAQRTVAAMREAGRLGRHTLDVRCDSAWVQGDETRLEQVVANLLENAAKYTPQGGRIWVRTRVEEGEAVLEVGDTGVGIAPELLPRVFELFTQGERTLDRSQGGLGLGLALVRQLVQLHGGRVTAASDGVGEGATFRVCLAQVPAPQAQAAPATEAPEARPLRILIVEDNPDGRETLAMMLSLQGNEVHEAEDGPGGVDRALQLAPDAAVVDIGLPGFDGYEVARRVRAAERGRGIRLIALTGYGQEDDRQKALRAGFDWFLVKPANLQALNDILASIQGMGRPSGAAA